jgi:hypothetical protein
MRYAPRATHHAPRTMRHSQCAMRNALMRDTRRAAMGNVRVCNLRCAMCDSDDLCWRTYRCALPGVLTRDAKRAHAPCAMRDALMCDSRRTAMVNMWCASCDVSDA